jgi:hypothetical protein
VTQFTDVSDDWNVQKNAQGIVAMWGSGESPISDGRGGTMNRSKKRCVALMSRWDLMEGAVPSAQSGII